MKNENIVGTMNICRWESGPCPEAGVRTRDGSEFTASIAVLEIWRQGSPCEVTLRRNGSLYSQTRVTGLTHARRLQRTLLRECMRYSEKKSGYIERRGGRVEPALA